MKKEVTLELIENPWYKDKIGYICDRCDLHTSSGETPVCRVFISKFKINCQDAKYIVKIKKNFESCTRENTKVGDTIYNDKDAAKHVEYIFKTPSSLSGREYDFIFSTNTQTEVFGCLKEYKKEI